MDFFQMPPRCRYSGPRGESSRMRSFFDGLKFGETGSGRTASVELCLSIVSLLFVYWRRCEAVRGDGEGQPAARHLPDYGNSKFTATGADFTLRRGSCVSAGVMLSGLSQCCGRL